MSVSTLDWTDWPGLVLVLLAVTAVLATTEGLRWYAMRRRKPVEAASVGSPFHSGDAEYKRTLEAMADRWAARR